jgi:hypothetical protein
MIRRPTLTTTRVITVLLVCSFIAIVLFLGVRAFQPPMPLSKLEAVKPGMTASNVRQVLGTPTQVYSGRSYAASGTNYQIREQWTYQRALVFGYVNVLFDTNGTVELAHYEPF